MSLAAFGQIASTAASTAAGIAGSIGGAELTARQARHEAKRSRYFQRHMSNTAVRRRVVDMAKAGINPILAAGAIGGAGTPPGGMAPVPDFGQAITGGIATALAVRRQRQELKNMKQVEHKDESQKDLNDAGISLAGANENVARHSAHGVQLENARKEVDLMRATAKGKQEGTAPGKFLRSIDTVIKSFTGRN